MKWEDTDNVLGTFAKLQKVSVSLIMSVHLPTHLEQVSSHWMDFHEI
jgi:hypothetical protein